VGIILDIMMHRVISSLALFCLIATLVDAGVPYLPMDLGPWGIDTSSINYGNTVPVASSRRTNTDSQVLKTTNRKDKTNIELVVKKNLSNELDEAEEAFFHAVKSVEDVIIHAIDDEVEVLFPHHQK
jgi:hypothetical protein